MTETRDGVLPEGMNKGVQMAPKARKGKEPGQSLEPSEDPALPSATLI